MLQAAIMGTNFPPITELLQEAPLRWQNFFESAFAHDEDERPESVAVFWNRLRDCLDGGK